MSFCVIWRTRAVLAALGVVLWGLGGALVGLGGAQGVILDPFWSHCGSFWSHSEVKNRYIFVTRFLITFSLVLESILVRFGSRNGFIFD